MRSLEIIYRLLCWLLGDSVGRVSRLGLVSGISRHCLCFCQVRYTSLCFLDYSWSEYSAQFVGSTGTSRLSSGDAVVAASWNRQHPSVVPSKRSKCLHQFGRGQESRA